MNKIKDFFYDKNDIIIVLIILALAGFIIYSRIGIIMDYPEKLADENATTVQTTVTETTTASEESTTKAKDSAASSTEVEIKITDKDTSVTVAQKLEKAGVIESATEFEGYISNMDKADKIKSGTFKIKKGSSFEKILNTITK